jgi:hypothetical protein
MYRTILLVPSLLFALFSLAQKGTVAGTINAPEAGKVQPMPFVNVLLKGTTTGATTDLDGRYSFDAEPGTYILLVSFVGYEPVEKEVVVTSGTRTMVDVQLLAAGVDIKEFEVISIKDREQEGILLMERKEASSLVQNLGAQELKKKGASDVAEGVQKIVGLSTVGGRYVVVRGLGDRYNAAYLNGLPLPSPDPDMKVAPLDIFPTDIVSNIQVTKSFSPELYGDFSGGAVDIQTKKASGENILRVSLGGGMNSQSTFRSMNSYRGGANDFWGREDGTRTLPSVLTRQPGSFVGERSPLATNLNPTSATAMPDLQFGIYGGTRIKLLEKVSLDLVGTANYRNENRYRDGLVRIINSSNTPLVDYTMKSWQFNTQSSALGTAVLNLGDHHSIGYTALWVNMSSDEHRVNEGDHFDYNDRILARRFTYRQNGLFTQQVFGRHGFGTKDRLLLEWSGSRSTTTSAEPDRRQLVYLIDRTDGTTRFNAIDRLENHRWSSALEEQETAARVGVSYRLVQREGTDGPEAALTLRTGAQIKRKDRSFGYDIVTYDLQNVNGANPAGVDVNTPDSYLNNESFQQGDFSITNVTGPESDHWISQDINAAHVSAEVDVLPNKLKVLGGLRVEDGEQRIIYRKQSDSFYQAKRIAQLNSTELLPFGSIRYDVSKNDVLRASASRTISRPGFREMGPFEYTEFFAGTKNIGNPDLQNGTNLNADLRYERFGTGGELLAFGAFGKLLDNTIEKVALATASGQLQSFRNTGSAVVAGVEMEFIRNLGKLMGRDSTVWNDLNVGLNMSLIHSELTIDNSPSTTDAADIVLTNERRALQGASPYLVNLDITYARNIGTDRKATATLAYNVFGPRVFAAGANGLGDQFELPVNTLNLILRADLSSRWQVNLNLRNLLDAEFRIEQETPAGKSLINTYRIGRSISAGVSYRIF